MASIDTLLRLFCIKTYLNPALHYGPYTEYNICLQESRQSNLNTISLAWSDIPAYACAIQWSYSGDIGLQVCQCPTAKFSGESNSP